ncbi:MAG: hypothetical protein M1814_002693 [Vezdaea aestivalis]|nr:MAG: hypothetical protein M1814_002693 [Vezdaea aestivalis]
MHLPPPPTTLLRLLLLLLVLSPLSLAQAGNDNLLPQVDDITLLSYPPDCRGDIEQFLDSMEAMRATAQPPSPSPTPTLNRGLRRAAERAAQRQARQRAAGRGQSVGPDAAPLVLPGDQEDVHRDARPFHIAGPVPTEDLPSPVGDPHPVPTREYSTQFPFVTWQQLCAAEEAGGAPSGNLGGMCFVEVGKTVGIFAFDVNLGAPHMVSVSTFRAFCRDKCECQPLIRAPGTTKKDEDKDGGEVVKSESWGKGQNHELLTEGRSRRMSDVGGSGSVYKNRYAGVTSVSAQCGLEAVCRDFSCGWTGVEGCKCVASRYDRGVFGAVGCRVSSGLSGGGRKRDLERQSWACPCNATFVSRTCCDSLDGLVWDRNDFAGVLDLGIGL